jgi:hypothetical protein
MMSRLLRMDPPMPLEGLVSRGYCEGMTPGTLAVYEEEFCRYLWLPLICDESQS